MLALIAQKISSFFVSKNIISRKDKEIYDYSFEILLSTILNFFVVIMIAHVTHTVVSTIWFLIGFMAIRSTAGGFHAETHMACFFILMCTYGVYVALLLVLSNSYLQIITIALAITSEVLVLIFSPVEDRNRTFCKEEYRKFKVKSNITVFVLLSVSFIFILFFENIKWGFSVVAGVCVAAISLLAGYIKNMFCKHRKQGERSVENAEN